MKEWLKKYVIPKAALKRLRPAYHGMLAELANFYYGQPSKKLVVIGVTGTAGKSTTVQMLAKILNDNGKKAGFLTTVNFYDGFQEHINKHGLSMPGEIKLQKSLRQMVKQGCGYAIIEATSEGMEQNRHIGIQFDAALFTNISPAHIDSHGSFEKYRQAKERLFNALENSKKKVLCPKKIIGVNADDPNAQHFLNYSAEIKFGITLENKKNSLLKYMLTAGNVTTGEHLEFSVADVKFRISLVGKFNIYNALLAAGCANALGVEMEQCALSLRGFTQIAGRMQEISNSRGIQIFVDYAPEPVAMKNALISLTELPHKRIIHVFGSTGGHRDVSKRFEFGEISAEYADSIIITNDDVYESDPKEIAANIELGIRNYELGKEKSVDHTIILDRREAINRALTIAQPGDIVLLTGKGSEQFLVLPGNKRIDWDEREVVREELEKLV
jgi:UDP-N-acetylmuramoyl-L-alanyl-D-glutamate--2,6-diaminopimelate ligase